MFAWTTTASRTVAWARHSDVILFVRINHLEKMLEIVCLGLFSQNIVRNLGILFNNGLRYITLRSNNFPCFAMHALCMRDSLSALKTKKSTARKRKGHNVHLGVEGCGTGGSFSRSHKKLVTDLGMLSILTKALVQCFYDKLFLQV